MTPQLKVGAYNPLLPFARSWLAWFPASLLMAAVSSWMQRSCPIQKAWLRSSRVWALSQSSHHHSFHNASSGSWDEMRWDVLFVAVLAPVMSFCKPCRTLMKIESYTNLWVSRDDIRGQSNRKSTAFNSNVPLPFLQHLVISLFYFIFLWICLFPIFRLCGIIQYLFLHIFLSSWITYRRASLLFVSEGYLWFTGTTFWSSVHLSDVSLRFQITVHHWRESKQELEGRSDCYSTQCYLWPRNSLHS